jgi:hypothetical protein
MRNLFISLMILSPLIGVAQELPEWAEQRLSAHETVFQINNSFNPIFYEADFDGDGKSDIAIAVKNKLRNDISGIVFYLKSDTYFLAGAGNGFGNAGGDFSWVNEWKIFDTQKTYQITFKENGDIDGEEEVLLENPAISIRQSEGSGGLIYFNGEKFIWVHQGG